MDDKQVCSEIAYLDNFSEPDASTEFSSHANVAAIVRAAVQLEMAKQAHWPNAENVALRVASLESQVEAMRHLMLMNHRGYPVVQYVSVSQPKRTISPPVSQGQRAFPRSLVVFYCLGIALSISFAVLLALSAFGTSPVHPFLALLGFVGGIGWLTTAWSDLLLLKAGSSWRTATTRNSNEDDPHHQQEPLVAIGKR
jgi:hypothetical protein